MVPQHIAPAPPVSSRWPPTILIGVGVHVFTDPFGAFFTVATMFSLVITGIHSWEKQEFSGSQPNIDTAMLTVYVFRAVNWFFHLPNHPPPVGIRSDDR